MFSADDIKNALFGGALIGLAATSLALLMGRVCGVSGIFYGILKPVRGEVFWKAAFVFGLLLGGLLGGSFFEDAFLNEAYRSPAVTIVAGLFVGFGTRLGGGCTSGHGVCGISRFSQRSIIATIVFIVAGAITVFLMNRSGGVQW